MAPLRGQDTVKRLANLRRKNSQFAAAGKQRIGGQNTGSAGIGNDCEASPGGPRLLGEHIGHRKQIGNGVHAQHPGPPEGGIQHFVAAGKRTRMRGCRFGGRIGSSRLDDNDRLVQRHFPRRGKERTGVADGLHVNQNALGAWIVAEIINQIAPVHIEHRSGGDECAEPHTLAQAPVQNRGQKRATLADESDIARQGNSLCECRIQSVHGFITPRQFGPMRRIPPRRACVRTSCSSSSPAAPNSRKPAEMMMAPCTPASAH